MKSENEAKARARGIKLMAFDVDGVLSNGSLFYTDAGDEIKAFNARDGYGILLLKQAGVEVAIITGRKAPCVEWRMKNLGIELFYQGIDDKLSALRSLLDKLGIEAHEAGYMGDDIIDLQIMDACGFSATPADSHALAQHYARYIASKAGGHGAVREVCEFILNAQGKLDAMLARYLPAAGK